MAVKVRRRTYRSAVRAAALDESRGRIVEAARKLLAGGKDVPAFSLDAVAREAGVTRLTVYNQFESRRGLMEAVFDSIAREGGLFELSAVFAEPDGQKALRRVVVVFCHFWAMHVEVMQKFEAFAQLDEEMATSLKERTERRRQLLTALVRRLDAVVTAPSDLVDVLFALTSMEFYRALSIRRRSAAAVEELIWDAVKDALKRFTSVAGR